MLGEVRSRARVGPLASSHSVRLALCVGLRSRLLIPAGAAAISGRPSQKIGDGSCVADGSIGDCQNGIGLDGRSRGRRSA